MTQNIRPKNGTQQKNPFLGLILGLLSSNLTFNIKTSKTISFIFKNYIDVNKTSSYNRGKAKRGLQKLCRSCQTESNVQKNRLLKSKNTNLFFLTVFRFSSRPFTRRTRVGAGMFIIHSATLCISSANLYISDVCLRKYAKINEILPWPPIHMQLL